MRRVLLSVLVVVVVAVAGAVVLVLGASGATSVGVGAGEAQAVGGQLDPSFGRGGRLVTDVGAKSDDTALDMALQRDGKIVVVGGTESTHSTDIWHGTGAVVRYTTGGKLDPSFGKGGKVSGGLGLATAVAVQADGKIVAVGYSGIGHGEDDAFELVRYTTDGKLDRHVVADLRAGGDDRPFDVALQRDGKIVVAGGSSVGTFPGVADWDFALVRYRAGGKLDRGFGRGGKVLTDLGRDDTAYAVALQTDGKIVAVGSSDARGRYQIALVRYTIRGRVDTSFGGGGKVLTGLGDKHDCEAVAVVVQADGKIVVAGWSAAKGKDFVLLRYMANGKLDASFGRGGKVVTYLRARNEAGASALAVRQDGRIVVAGSSDAHDQGDFALARYTPRGILDGTFGRGGKVVTNLGADDSVAAVAIQPDGKIIAAGQSFKGYDRGGGDFAVARYTK